MLRVRPGVELVRASLLPTRELITLDFPTFERPRNAISGRLGSGKWAAFVAAARNCAITLMLKCAMGAGNWQAGRQGTENREWGIEKRRSALPAAKLLAQRERLVLI